MFSQASVCPQGGVCGKGGGHAWQGACVAGEKANAADSTHPTGMHSCFFLYLVIAT